MARWQVMWNNGGITRGKVSVEAESIVQAIYDVCAAEEIAHRAVLEAKKVR